MSDGVPRITAHDAIAARLAVGQDELLAGVNSLLVSDASLDHAAVEVFAHRIGITAHVGVLEEFFDKHTTAAAKAYPPRALAPVFESRFCSSDTGR